MRLVGLSDSRWELAMPYAEHLVGDPDTGVIHGGVVTALLDNAAGLVAYRKDRHHREEAVATLDMRIDDLASARPGQPLFVRADCIKRTREIVFVRAQAFQETIDSLPP